MAKSKIFMPHPCALNWEQLQGNANNRHCTFCNKNVFDFTQFSDRDLLDFFKNQPQRTCGLFLDSQLENSRSKQKTLLPFFLKAAAALSPFVIFSKVSAQGETVSQTIETTSNITIKGIVFGDEFYSPLVNAKISLWFNNQMLYSFLTEVDGTFHASIDSSNFPKQVLVVIESKDMRVRYEEWVGKSEIFSFFNRAIAVFESDEIVVETAAPNQKVLTKNRKNSSKWNPFKKKTMYKHFRPLGCIEF